MNKLRKVIMVLLIGVSLMTSCQKDEVMIEVAYSVYIESDTRVTGLINDVEFELRGSKHHNNPTSYFYEGWGYEGDEVVVKILSVDFPDFPETAYIKLLIKSGDREIGFTPTQVNPISIIL